ncbi:unnamed protein product, partial [marine sediment metagenome]
MNHMGYDALNIADGELRVGLNVFDELKQEARFPFLAANIFFDEKGLPVGKRYLIKEFEGFKVGVVGVASPDCFDEKYLSRTSLVIKDPEEHLRQLLPEIEAKADVIVLLSHLGLAATEDLLGKLSGIDVAIVGHESRSLHSPKFVGKTIVVQGVPKGGSLGVLELRFDRDGFLKGHKGKTTRLTKSIPVDPTVQDLVATYRRERTAARRAAHAKRRKKELMRKNQKFLSMTPE